VLSIWLARKQRELAEQQRREQDVALKAA